MVLRGAGGMALLLLGSLLVVPPAASQDAPVFLLLGEDATGDAQASGVPMLDTWIDINGLAVATIGTDLVFHLGLQGTTTEAGQYCWMAAFEFGGDEFVGLDCYEGVAYESDNTLSGVSPPSTSRGTNVASSVVFDDTGAVITIPLAAIGAAVGDVIEDIYGLTYATRGLVVTDTVPDAKRTAAADESLGAYVVGGGAPGGEGDAPIRETLNGTGFAHAFANATSATYVLDLAVPYANASVAVAANATAGRANVTITRGNETLLSFAIGNGTANGTANATADGTANGTANATAPRLVGNATGNWTITIVYDGFVGELALNVTQQSREAVPTARTNTTSGLAPASDAEDEEAPAAGLLVAAVAMLGVALLRRRR